MKSKFYLNDYNQSFDTFENNNAAVCVGKSCLKTGGLRLTKLLEYHQEAIENVARQMLASPKVKEESLD